MNDESSTTPREPSATRHAARLERSVDFGAVLPGVGVFGGVRRFIEIGNELVRRGHRYVLYTPNGERPTWLPFAGEVQDLEALRTAHHDVLLNNDTWTLELFAAADAGLKLFYCVVEKLQDERRVLTDPRWTILANSSGIQERIRRRYGIQAERVVGGLDDRVFRPAPAPTAAPPPEGPFRVLAYGRVSRRAKGVPLVVRATEAFARAVAKQRAVQLVLFDNVGPGNETDPREHVRSAVPTEFHINLSQAELARLYASCHLFVSAERKAGWSNTVAEAMACGVPVVCTLSGTRDLARHRDTAWTVRWRHPWFLTHGMRAVFGDPDLAARMRQRAIEHVQQFTWPHVVDQLEDVVRRRLAATGTAP